MIRQVNKRVLEASLNAANPGERADALRRVSEWPVRSLVGRVEALLDDRRAEVRYEAAQTIGELLRGSGRAPDALVRHVDDRAPLVRVAAIEALGDIGERRGAAHIQARLLDRDPLVRAYAGAAIGALRPRWARAVLTKAAAKERSSRARVGLYEGLFLSGDRRALHPILALLRSRQYRVRCAVANTVAGLALDREAATAALDVLETALASEPTVAAKSSLERAIDVVSQVVRGSPFRQHRHRRR